MPARGRPRIREKFEHIQITLAEDSFRRISAISKETYAPISAVIRRVVDAYFRMIDEKELRAKRGKAKTENENESEAA